MKYLIFLLVAVYTFGFQINGQESGVDNVEVLLPRIAPVDQKVGVYKENGLMGIKNLDTDDLIVKAQFEEIHHDRDRVFRIHHKNKLGIFDANQNKLVVPIRYDEILRNNKKGVYKGQSDYYYIIKSDNKYGVIDFNGRSLISIDYDFISPFGNRLRVRKNGKFGIYLFGQPYENIEVKYDATFYYKKTNSLVAYSDQSYDLFDGHGGILLNNQKLITDFYGYWEAPEINELLVLSDVGQEGIFDLSTKKFIIPRGYDKITDRFKGQYIVKKNGKFGLMSRENKIIMEPNYDTLAFLKPFPKVLKAKRSGNKKIDTSSYDNSLLLAGKRGRVGLINRNGVPITKFAWDEITHIRGLYKAKRNGKYSLLDSKGKKMSDETFDEIGNFHFDIAPVFYKGKYNYITTKGEVHPSFEKPSVARGYKNLGQIYADFIAILKSENDVKLKVFCRDLVPDSYTVEYMTRISFNHKGFLTDIKNGEITYEELASKIYNKLRRFRSILKENGQLTKLEYLNQEQIPNRKALHGDYYVEEASITGIFVAEKEEIKYSIGTFMLIDGFWKTFLNSSNN